MFRMGGAVPLLPLFAMHTNDFYDLWPKDFTEVTMIALKKKSKATKCSDHRTISLIAHTAKIIAKILKRRIERKFEDKYGNKI
jgi:hypothetical protein